MQLLKLSTLLLVCFLSSCSDQSGSSIDSEDYLVDFRDECTCSYDFSESNTDDCDVISYIGASSGFGDISGNGTGLLIQFDPDILSGHVMGPDGPQPCDPDVCFGGGGLEGINMVIYNPEGEVRTETLIYENDCGDIITCNFEVWGEYYELHHDYNEIFIDWDCEALQNLSAGSTVSFCMITECPCLAHALAECPFSPYGCFVFKVSC